MQDQDENIARRSLNGILSNFDYQKKELNARHLKELRTVVRKNEKIIPPFVDRLFEEFQKQDCDRRLGTLLVTDYFFQRSHAFRTELLDHIQDLLLYTLETDPLHFPLPPPLEAAKCLKKEMLKIVKSWIDKFAIGYNKLKTASQYLIKCKNFDFREANEQLLVERQRAEEQRMREEAKAKKVGEKVQKLLDESKTDIERTLTECRTSIKLIFPDLFHENGEQQEEAEASEKPGEADVKLHGYKENEALTVVIPTADIHIEETPNNAALVDALRDSQILLRKFEKSLKKWLKKLTQAGAVTENAALIRQLLEFKAEIGHELKRADQLRIKKAKRHSCRAAEDGSGSESEDEFEDVVKDGLELGIPEEPEEDELSADILKQIESMEKKGKRKSNDSTTSSVDPDAPGPSGLNSSGGQKKEEEPQKPKIPKLQFGLDLKYWGQEIEPAAIVRNQFDGHRFWRAPDQPDEPATEVEDIYRSRQMTFLTQPAIIKHKCRAPLPSGKLCPRMDLKVCPFHGPIVPRDEMGFPVEELGKGSLLALKNAEERIRKFKEQEEKDYVQDVETAVGIPLAPNEQKKRGANRNKAYGTARKREKTQTELSRERLQAKLFNKTAMKRVAETLTTIQQERAQKNFSNQFNYAVTRR